MKDPGGLDSDRRVWQSEVAKPPTLETTMLQRTELMRRPGYLNRSSRNFYVFEPPADQPGQGDHTFVARRWGEDALATDLGPAMWRACCAGWPGLRRKARGRTQAGLLPIIAAIQEAGLDVASDPPSAERRNRKLRRWSMPRRFDLAPPAPSEDRRDRWGRWSARF